MASAEDKTEQARTALRRLRNQLRTGDPEHNGRDWAVCRKLYGELKSALGEQMVEVWRNVSAARKALAEGEPGAENNGYLVLVEYSRLKASWWQRSPFRKRRQKMLDKTPKRKAQLKTARAKWRAKQVVRT